MRGTVVKRIRREARAKAATNPTKYETTWRRIFTGKHDSKGNKVMDYRGTVICTGFRRVYQGLKRSYINA